MGDHVAVPSSQVQFPSRSVVRTMVQTGIPAFLGLAVLLPAIIEIIVQGYGDTLPAEVRLWMLGFAGFITVTAGIVARIMALPGVDNWVRHTGLLKWLAPSAPVDADPEPLVVEPENPLPAEPVKDADGDHPEAVG